MTDEHKAVSDAIKAIRAERNISQRTFAESINVSAASVRNWETGVCSPSMAIAMDIDAAYDSELKSIIEKFRPEGPKRRRRSSQGFARPVQAAGMNPGLSDMTDPSGQNTQNIQYVDYDDVSTFNHIITLLKLFMLLNPNGRKHVIDLICEDANNPAYQCRKLRERNGTDGAK